MLFRASIAAVSISYSSTTWAFVPESSAASGKRSQFASCRRNPLPIGNPAPCAPCPNGDATRKAFVPFRVWTTASGLRVKRNEPQTIFDKCRRRRFCRPATSAVRWVAGRPPGASRQPAIGPPFLKICRVYRNRGPWHLVASPSRVSDPNAGRGRQFIVGLLFVDGCRRFTVDLAMALYCRINGVGALEDVSGSEASPSGLLKEVLSGESPAPRTLQAVE